MSETINELYLKYIDAFSSLEDDRYFRYLFEIIQAGDNVLQQNLQVLHKVVDETWLTMIEDTLEAINTIIEKPRRFVATAEEVVPVALAKKITAQSVRHLSMNTQFIASNEDGDIQPTRVLNITQEDSYDLYENRFIYHLIQKLIVFIDKRTDVIFWSTGDEVRNTMTLESKIDDAYEEIEYRIEMKVKNHQSFAENDADNKDIFMRIDRVRRMTMALRGSAFCELMAGCAKVRSPIQRTNLLMKDPNYRKCYQLWQFLENYEGVGYNIEEQNTALEFDEEYLIQMYINLISNYAVFKSLSEEVEDRNLEELEKVFHQVLKPKFVKEIHEEIVDDYNIPDVEIRKVIIEEVTQAQLDAEAKLAEETALREQAEAARDEAEGEIQQAMIRSQQFMQQMMEAQEQAELAQSLQAAAETAKEEADLARSEAERHAAEAEQLRLNAEQSRDAALTEKETAAAAEKSAKAAMEAAEAERAQAQAKAEAAEAARSEAERKQAEAEKAAEDALAERSKSLQAQLDAQAQADADREAKALAEQERAEALRAKQDADAAAEQAKQAAAEANKTAEADRAERKRMEAELQAARAALEEAEQARQTAENAQREAEKQAEAQCAAREAAEAAAKESTLAREAAEQACAEAEKREKTLREDLDTCEKKLEKAQKKLESTSVWHRFFGGKQ